MPRPSTYTRYLDWLINGESGTSSIALGSRMLGVKITNASDRVAHPADPADLRRCVLLLDRFPVWRQRMYYLLRLSPAWNALARNWTDLEATLRSELGADLAPGPAPQTWQKMQSILEGVKHAR